MNEKVNKREILNAAERKPRNNLQVLPQQNGIKRSRNGALA
ncbi:hypothetical protein [Bacillus sp. YC2]|nr:hypothetical protein [Bacillus sp. YC2]